MNLLVLGGTRFVGRAIVEAALAGQHDVTLFNRGTASDVVPAARRITGDRGSAAAVARLSGSDWDAVVDVSAYRPTDVRSVLRELGNIQHYVFISTISVYAEPLQIGAEESAQLLQVSESIAADDPRAYGGLKVLCERELRDRLGERLTVLRPTVVIGPHDYTDRFPWWVRNIAAGGRMEVPGRLKQPVQLTDANDLADFAIRTVEQRIFGTFNTVGPKAAVTLGDMIEMLSAVLASQIDLVPVFGDDVASRFPLVLAADGSKDGWFSVSSAAALQRGLTLRPLTESALAVRNERPTGVIV